MSIDLYNYGIKGWDNNICLRKLVRNSEWYKFMEDNKKNLEKIEKYLLNRIKNGIVIFPYPKLIFYPFNILSPQDIKVVIIGQDPYHNFDIYKNKTVPNAMGLSFSVPYNSKIPESLMNIYKNMYKYGNIDKIPNTGFLFYWMLQGVFLINSALTTEKMSRNAHSKLWCNFTNNLLNYLNDSFKNIVFIVWGKNANIICKNLDKTRHLIITSSHPSPLSCNKTFYGHKYGFQNNQFVNYNCFNNIDHFGISNKYLKLHNKSMIDWNLINKMPYL